MKIKREQTLHGDINDLQIGDGFDIKLNGVPHTCHVINIEDGKRVCCFDEGLVKCDRLEDHMPRALSGIYDAMPRKWKDRIKIVGLLSIREVFGIDENFNDCDGQLDYFKDARHRIVVDENGDTAWYWLKEQFGASASQFCGCGHGGIAYCNPASYADNYVRPRFVIV